MLGRLNKVYAPGMPNSTGWSNHFVGSSLDEFENPSFESHVDVLEKQKEHTRVPFICYAQRGIDADYKQRDDSILPNSEGYRYLLQVSESRAVGCSVVTGKAYYVMQ